MTMIVHNSLELDNMYNGSDAGCQSSRVVPSSRPIFPSSSFSTYSWFGTEDVYPELSVDTSSFPPWSKL